MMFAKRSAPLAFVAAGLLSACATTQPAADRKAAASVDPTTVSQMPAPVAAAPANGAAAARGPAAVPPGIAAAAARPPASSAPPFADVIKGANQTDGYFPLWKKEDRVWIEIPLDRLDKPFFLTINMSRGIGEKFLLGGLQGSWYSTGGEYVAQFRKAAGNLQLIARNTMFTARAGSPEERAVKNAFSDSLLASATIASAPHPERNSILIDANALLMTDMPRGSHVIEKMYRNAFQFDARNSFIESAKTNAERTVFDVTAHYAQPRIPVAHPGPAGQPAPPHFPAPRVLEDPRSLFLGYLYTFTKLPDTPMTARRADSRIGHFATPKVDFSNESKVSPVLFYVNRWRLEKKDTAAAVSEPTKPIVFWLSNEIPEKHREPIRAGILEWNKAFERVGFKDAIIVKQQPDDADFDLGEPQYSSVRWMPTANPSFGAIGPSQIDPRTGEILVADIGWDANMVRHIRAMKSEGVVTYQPMYDEASGEIRVEAIGMESGRLCAYRDHAAREVGFALALLEARGELDADGPAADELVAAFLKDVTMHEVGHTLGLRHNFRASTVASLAQLSDKAHAEKHGLTGSVMEYTPVNLALKGEPQGAYFTPTLGAYDYWAIEYAYKPIAADDEKTELAKIAGRANQRELAFATDEDVRFGIDPTVNQGDLGDDPLGFFGRRVKLSQELWARLEDRPMADGESYSVLRRRFMTGFTQLGGAMAQAVKYVGGSELVNDFAGSTRLPVTPVAATKQREALAIVTEGLLKSDSFKVSPQFMRKLVTDRLDRDAMSLSNPEAVPAAVELALSDRVLAVQRDVLNRLLSPVVARRVIENGTRKGKAEDVFSLSELYGTLQGAIWSEARRGVEADVMRRNLQREHLRRTTAGLLGTSAGYPADARGLMRRDAQELRGWLLTAAKKPGLTPETRAHYAESAATLTEALKAPLVRTGV
jgi:hypothetical protein